MGALSEGIDTALEDGVIVAGGSSDPRIFFVACGQNGEPVPIADYGDVGAGHAFSFYAASLSPDHSFLAVASKPFFDPPGDPSGGIAYPSLVRVYPLRGADAGTLPLRHSWYVYETSGVSALLVEDDGSVWLGCGDGHLRAFSVHTSRGQPDSVIAAHQGWVLALAQAGQSRLATFGADGRLVVWDLVTGAELAHAGPIECPPLGALMSIAWDSDRNEVFVGSGTGFLHALRLPEGQVRRASIHASGFAAVAVHPELGRVVTGGAEDGLISIVDPETLQPVTTARVGAHVHGIVPLPGGRVACFDASRRVTVWSISADPQCLGTRGTIDARSWAGPNVAVHAAIQRQKQVRDRVTTKEEFQEALRRNDLDAAESLLDRLRALGGGGQAMAAEAALHRSRGHLLKEFLVWRSIEFAEGESMPPSARYLQADNLAQLLEPELALEKFETLDDFRDAARRAQQLRDHPMFGIDPCDLVRGDFRKPEQVLEELDKSTLLGRCFSGTVVIRSSGRSDVAGQVTPGELADRIRERYDGTIGGHWEVHVERRPLYVGEVFRRVDWVRIERSPNISDHPELQVALELFEAPQGARYSVFVLFNPRVFSPGDPTDAEQWNAEVARQWLATYDDEGAKSWAQAAVKKCTTLLKGLANEKRRRTGSRN